MLKRVVLVFGLLLSFHANASKGSDHTGSKNCEHALKSGKTLVPREIDAIQSYKSIVDFIHSELIVKRKAPGLVVGISGTDSIAVFLAAVDAFARVGRPDRVAGVHFTKEVNPGDTSSELSSEFWFQREVVPWLKVRAPGAQIILDTSINPKRDGLRWGALMDFSILQDYDTGVMRPPQERFWILGTRNATEQTLRTYSNMSREVAAQPLTPYYKSEVLKICAYLGVPNQAIQRSCESDCACGRDQLPAVNIPEVDAILMTKKGELESSYIEAAIPGALRKQLEIYIESRIAESLHKDEAPYWHRLDHVPLKQSDFVPKLQDLIADWDGGKKDIKTVSKLTPQILKMDAAWVSQLFRTYDSAWLPEALTLMGHKGLRSNQVDMIARQIYAVNDFSSPELKRLAQVSSRIGHYAFSFPQWRFVSLPQKNSYSMAEEFGFIRLRRTNDVRDSLLPHSDPERDEMGSGFVLTFDNVTVEYRRSYILVSEKTETGRQTLVIRNSSHFFGRDRLPETAYLSFADWSKDDLENFGKRRMMELGDFVAIQDIFTTDMGKARTEKLKVLNQLLGYLDRVNQNMSDWLQDPEMGSELLLKLIKTHSEKSEEKRAYLGVVEGASASWSPRDVRRMDPELLSDLKNQGWSQVFPSLVKGNRLVIFSGPKGDFP